jgi:hypothetical protein
VTVAALVPSVPLTEPLRQPEALSAQSSPKPDEDVLLSQFECSPRTLAPSTAVTAPP